MTMESSVVHGAHDLAALADQWEACRRRSPQPRYRESFEHLSREVARRPAQRLSAIALREHAEVVGVVPVVEERRAQHWNLRLPGRTVHPLSVTLTTAVVPTETLLVPDTDAAHELALHALLDAYRDTELVRFPAVRVGTRLDRWLRTGNLRGTGRWLSTAPPDTRRQIRFGDDFDAYLEEQLHRQARTNLRRDHKRLITSGKATIHTVRDAEDVPGFVADAGAVWARSWHGATGAGWASPERLVDDYSWLAHRGQLRGHVLTADGEPIAFLLAVVADDTIWIEKTAFDPTWGPLAPGKTLLAHAMRSAHAEGCRTTDFVYGDYPYKRIWSNTATATRAVTLVRAQLRPTAVLLPPTAYRKARGVAVDAVSGSRLEAAARRFSARRLGR
jgi:CelD/BcsL family acetyltransferase involved in cellulose biosynthesis